MKVNQKRPKGPRKIKLTIDYSDVNANGPGFVAVGNALVMQQVACPRGRDVLVRLTFENEAVIAFVKAAKEGGICG